jgi:hypothetical protein
MPGRAALPGIARIVSAKFTNSPDFQMTEPGSIPLMP